MKRATADTARRVIDDYDATVKGTTFNTEFSIKLAACGRQCIPICCLKGTTFNCQLSVLKIECTGRGTITIDNFTSFLRTFITDCNISANIQESLRIPAGDCFAIQVDSTVRCNIYIFI